MRIRLYFYTLPNLELLEKGIDASLMRLLGKIQLEAKAGWTESEVAIIDTGAPFSLIPLEMWQESEVEILTDSSVRGLIPKKQCVLPVKVGKVAIRFVDEERISKSLIIKAYLAPNNKVPLITGFQDLLSELRVVFSYRERIAYVKEIE